MSDCDSFGLRLKEFIYTFYGNVRIFSEACDMHESTVSRYIHCGTKPNVDTLYRLYLAGVNINWLLSGNGDMLSDSPAGLELDARNMKMTKEESHKEKVTRAIDWIRNHYGSLERFCKEMELQYKPWYDLLIKRKRSGLEWDFPKYVVDAGCNPIWLETGEGIEYANNIRGTLFKEKIVLKSIANSSNDNSLDFIKRDEIVPVIHEFNNFLKKQEKFKSKEKKEPKTKRKKK